MCKILVIGLEMSRTCILAYYTGNSYAHYAPSKNPIIPYLWCVTSSIVVLQKTWATSILSGIIRMLGSHIGCKIAYTILYSLEAQLISFLLAIFLATTICSYLDRKNYIRLVLITIAIIFCVAIATQETNYFILSISYFIESFIGSVIARITRILTIPIYKQINQYNSI